MIIEKICPIRFEWNDLNGFIFNLLTFEYMRSKKDWKTHGGSLLSLEFGDYGFSVDFFFFRYSKTKYR